jgi:hypothetical protein
LAVPRQAGRARADRPSRPGRHARSRGREAVTIISAPAGSGKASLLRAWAGRPGQDHRIALLSVLPGQRGAQLFWLALLGAVRAATGGAESLPAAPEFNGQAMVDNVLSELAASGGPFVLIIDDLHELSSGYGENARAGVKAHFDTVTERGRAHHREIHRVLAAADIEVFTTTTTTFAIMQSLRLDRGPSGPVHP